VPEALLAGSRYKTLRLLSPAVGTGNAEFLHSTDLRTKRRRTRMSAAILLVIAALLVIAVGIALFLVYRETEADFPPVRHQRESTHQH